jgi:hypothetical protein
MATVIKRALLCALVAVGSLALVPANAEDAQVVAALPAVSADPVLERALDFIRESNDAQKKQIHRNEYRPAFDSKIVRSRRNSNHVYVMGGSAAIPM